MSRLGAKSLSRSLLRRMVVLASLALLGLGATIGLSMALTLQRVRGEMERSSVEATSSFDRLFTDIQSSMRATAEGLADRHDLEQALRGLQMRTRALMDVVYVGPDGAIRAQRHALGRSPWAEGSLPLAGSMPPFGKTTLGAVHFEGDLPFVDMATPVLDSISLPAGKLVARVDLTDLWNATLDIRVGQTGYAYIVDDTGQLVALRNRRLLDLGGSLRSLVGRTPQAIADAGLHTYVGLNGGRVLASGRALRTVPWFAVLEQPAREALGPFLALAVLLLALLATVILVSENTIKFARTRIVTPLQGLAGAVRQLAEGRLDQAVPVQNTDELGTLAEAFNSMAGQLRGAFAEREAQIAALRESEARFNTAFQFSPVALAITTLPEGKILAANRAFETVFGYAQADLAGLASGDLWLDDGERRQALDLLNRDLPVIDLETKVRHRGGDPRWVTYSGVIVTVGGRRCVLSAVIDITERKRSQEDKTRLQFQLMQAQKLESLGSLAGGVAHDMNNVLGAILSLASVHLELQPAGSPAHAAFETIHRATERGAAMVKRLLGFARQSPEEVRVLDLNAILREGVLLLERTTLAKVRLKLDLDPELRPVDGDASTLAHVFMNLCVNAVDAMGNDGTLILHSHNLSDGWVEIRVEDTGCGMSAEVLERAFDPFYTTKPIGKGTGLGLSMAYSAVKAHRGVLEITSQPAQGTVVAMRFPASAMAPAGEASRLEPSRPPGRALAVLLVDDDELIRHATGTLLQVLGHEAIVVDCGEGALQTLETGYAPDVVVLDMNMPGLGGAVTLARLRALRPTLPVLLATGRADQEALDLVAAYARVELRAKPYTLAALQARLEALG